MKPTIESNKSAGNWFSTLTCSALASGTSANPHLVAFTHPSAHGGGPAVKERSQRAIVTVSHQESLHCKGFAVLISRSLVPLSAALSICQGENTFPEAFLEMPLTTCDCPWTHVEKLWKSAGDLGVGRVFRGADQSQPLDMQSRSAARMRRPAPGQRVQGSACSGVVMMQRSCSCRVSCRL